MKSIRNHKKKTASALLLTFVFQIVPANLMALTGGPSQPEVQSFQPIGVSDMVDLFSGDFQYNLPLMDIDGYPINLNYSSQISTDMEASWVGLGWNLNPGAITRSMRGIPDEFKGDMVKVEKNIAPNKTYTVNVGSNLENFGFDAKIPATSTTKEAPVVMNAGLSLVYNSYNGFSLASKISAAASISDINGGDKTSETKYSLSLGSSQDGLDIAPDVSFKVINNENDKKELMGGFNLGLKLNTRAGLQEISFGIQSKRRDINNLGDGITIGLESYTPYIETPMYNASATFTYKTGAKFSGLFPNSHISGSISWQRLKQKVMNVPAFGYLNSEAADINSMMDINREKDGSFNKNTPLLPLTNYTYDLFSVNGQGISGTFRPFRGEVGNIYDMNSGNTSIGVGGGVDIGFGNTVKNGFNINVNYSNSISGKWDDHFNNIAKDHFTNRKGDVVGQSIKDYETYAFKQIGEMTTDDESFISSSYRGTQALRVGIKPNAVTYSTYPSLLDQYGNSYDFPADNYRKTRIKRNQQLTILTRDETERYGLENHLSEMYAAPSYHPGEMTVLKDDGARYVYGIAAYNCTQEETSFNTGRRNKNAQQLPGLNVDIDRAKGLVRYDYEDNTIDNNRGLNNYYSNTTMPAYAHSYLLTSILSTDYVDIDGEKGPSKGDIGTYTKFTYTKLNKAYKWRVPFEQFKANLNEGLYTDLDDNMGNYTYGEKELWYLTKIETKNSVAIFTLEDRKDGFGVINKNGGIGDVTTKLLRKITLYSKYDYENTAVPTPIKVVNFEYSYELCPSVPNNNKSTIGPDNNSAEGKLTLKKVYFTYGNSLRGKFSPYTFEYSSVNPSYGLKNNDRWGNYKPNNSALWNNEFPYVEQNKTAADNNAEAWLLKKIVLPSGGEIDVYYESDDYAYVQDLPAMQMFKITSFVGSYMEDGLLNSNNNVLIGPSPGLINKQYLTFKLCENVVPGSSVADDQKKFREKYLKYINDLYFRIKVDITSKGDFEYVSGYCELEDVTNVENAFMFSDGIGTTNYTHGYIKIKNVDIGDGNGAGLNVHPMSKAAWQFGRMNLNKELYGGVDDNTSNIQKFLGTISDASFVKPLIQGLMGQNGYLLVKNCGKEVILDHSFIRLNNPSGYKLGGGCRVKKITISDKWNSMIPSGAAYDASVYGQEYSYDTYDTESDRIVSSGVASNEPSVGGDENTLKQPIFFGDKAEKLLAPDDRFYLEGPVGESFYPTATVGYSKVTVKNLSHNNVTRHATGHVVNEFYTSKDFPTISQHTPLEAKQTSIAPLLKILRRYTRTFMAASQGYSIELNDMHGKPKAVWVFAENDDNPISGTEYRYKCKPFQRTKNSAKSFRLTSTVQVIKPDCTVEQQELGVEYDVVNDFRQETTTSYSGGFQGNLDNFLASVLPLSIPSVLQSVESDKRGFRSAVMTKVVNRYGIVDEVIAYDLGSKVGTKNLAYDSETGDVILTQTKNEFEDDIYSFTYPAHWYYENMGAAYKNYKMKFSGISFDVSGVSLISDASEWFTEGDEILSGSEKGWVSAVNSGSITVVNEIGKPYKPASSSNEIIIVRSGRRNILRANVGSVVAMANPLNGLVSNSFSKVINAASQVFRDDWKTYCECFEGQNSLMKISTNPYATGRKGIWRPYKSYTYLTNRELSIRNNNTNIRNDGSFVNYVPFWTWHGENWGINDVNWRWTSEITEYSPFGMELENRDPLDRYSAATYGYNNSLPLSVAANAKYSDIGFDGFEDYNFSNCTNDHFSFKTYSANKTELSSHTGRNSMRVTNSTNVKISKPIENCTP